MKTLAERRAERAALFKPYLDSITQRTRNDAGIVVERTNFQYSTRYRMTGKPELVEEEVQKVFQNYPSQGYGTWAHPPRYIEQGIVQVIVDRANSCD